MDIVDLCDYLKSHYAANCLNILLLNGMLSATVVFGSYAMLFNTAIVLSTVLLSTCSYNF